MQRLFVYQRVTFCLVAMLFASASRPANAQDERCGAGKDQIVKALETAGPNGTPKDFDDALQLLKRAASLCPKLGDAWYYRSLIEARLGHAAQAKFTADEATRQKSEAQAQGLQPFILSTSPAQGPRGVATNPRPNTPHAPPAVAQKWALVIGISSFADHAIPHLNYTSGDAQAFATLLKDPAVGRFPSANVHTLTDDQATTRNIKEQLNWIARHAQPADMVVIYLATHGSPRETDSVKGLNYLVTYDTEVRSLDEPDEDALYATAFPMIDLSSAVATRVRALRTLVVLDTCYSGGSIKDGGRLSDTRMMGKLRNVAPSPANLQRMSEGSGRIVFAASQVDQESLESDTLRHGYFTFFLLKHLRDAKGLTPLTQVYAAVQKEVSARVALDGKAQHLQQNPVIDRSSDEADFALGLPIGSAAAQ